MYFYVNFCTQSCVDSIDFKCYVYACRYVVVFNTKNSKQPLCAYSMSSYTIRCIKDLSLLNCDGILTYNDDHNIMRTLPISKYGPQFMQMKTVKKSLTEVREHKGT